MFNITSGNIIAGFLYTVAGAQSVVYNGTTYTTGQKFRGVLGILTFTYSGTGTQLLYEVNELQGFAVEFFNIQSDYPTFPETTLYNGFAIEFTQNASDILFNDTTNILGFALELIDYPFYSFEIIETRG